MNIIKVLNWRYATKQFDPNKKIPANDMTTILEAARLTASSFGVQPWRFVLVNNIDKRQELLKHSWNQMQVVEASHLLILCRLSTVTDQEVQAYCQDIAETRGIEVSSIKSFQDLVTGFISRMTDEQKQQWMKDQIYIVLGNLLTTCALLNIDTCPMEGFDAKAYDQILKLPEIGLNAVALLPMGYRLPADKYAALAKVRFTLDKLVVNID